MPSEPCVFPSGPSCATAELPLLRDRRVHWRWHNCVAVGGLRDGVCGGWTPRSWVVQHCGVFSAHAGPRDWSDQLLDVLPSPRDQGRLGACRRQMGACVLPTSPIFVALSVKCFPRLLAAFFGAHVKLVNVVFKDTRSRQWETCCLSPNILNDVYMSNTLLFFSSSTTSVRRPLMRTLLYYLEPWDVPMFS